ncbi:hypothetical protein [Sphingomonas prati]|uniref:Uncharacterized protein n=1 Tax=Sphingomonas prati TaxID=1843237 RepID=A0A7W9BSB7_9SPHN|nr:hypothetical protein [Sphingomonas prati]MBB5729239.1 hypothetical protein [Sphingomonas prati]
MSAPTVIRVPFGTGRGSFWPGSGTKLVRSAPAASTARSSVPETPAMRAGIVRASLFELRRSSGAIVVSALAPGISRPPATTTVTGAAPYRAATCNVDCPPRPALTIVAPNRAATMSG